MYLQKLTKLVQMNANDNDVTKNPEYRLYVIRIIPSLELLDDIPVT